MIGVIGAGSWGTALAIVLANKLAPRAVPIWARDATLLATMQTTGINQRYLPDITLPNNLSYQNDLAQFMAAVQDVLLVVPSHAFVPMLTAIQPYFTPQHRLVWATKGIEPNSGRFFHHPVTEILGNTCPCAVLSGPSFATEVARGLPTAVTIATLNQAFAQDLVNYFHAGHFRVYLNADLIGVQLCGAVKNILAVATGISDGLQFGANAKAALITRGLVELNRLGQALGAQQTTLLGLAGVGDIILSATDNQSRNRRFGLALATGKTLAAAQQEIGQVVEAIYNAREIYNLAKQHNVEVPIIEQVHFILTKQITPTEAVQHLLARQPTQEVISQ